MIERGRHLNIPRTERYCLLCKSNQIEDEKHFLLHCKKFNTQRNLFNEKISNILENASYKNANNKISFLFNNKSYSIDFLFHIKLFEYKNRFAIIIIPLRLRDLPVRFIYKYKYKYFISINSSTING
jgi:hypothetical protein